MRVVDGEWAYSDLAWNGQTEWLFNIARDPAEKTNLASSEPKVLKRMRELAGKVKEEALAMRGKLGGGKEGETPLGAGLKKQLKALGYIQ